jgi:hypothetical protein
MYVTFYIPSLPAVPEGLFKDLAALPGVMLLEASKLFKASENVAWFAEQIIRKYGVPYIAKVREPLSPPFLAKPDGILPTVGLPIPNEIRPEVPGLLSGYQQEAIFKFGHRPGVRLYWAPGSGKSLGAIYLSLLHPGTCVFVTRAGARATIAEEIAKFTSCSCLILNGSPNLGFSSTSLENLTQIDQLQLPSGSQLLAAAAKTHHGIGQWATASSLAKSPRRVLARLSWAGLDWRVPIPLERLTTTQGPSWSFQLLPVEREPLPRFLIVAWESLAAWLPTLLACAPAVVVFDEGHLGSSAKRFAAKTVRDDESGDTTTGLTIQYDRLKNRASAAEQLSKVCGIRIETTASPIRDRLRNLWAQLDLTEPGAWGKFNPYHATIAQQTGPYSAFYCNRQSWSERYCEAHAGLFGGIDSRGRAQPEIIAELKARMSYATHLVPYSVTHAQLPARRIQVTYLGPDDLAKPEQIEGTGPRQARVGDTARSMVEIKLAQACSQKRGWVAAKAVEALEGGSKVTILTTRKKDCQEIVKAIQKELNAGKKSKDQVPTSPIPVWIFDGDVPLAQRDQIRLDYMAAEGAACIVATGDSAGESLNIQDTDLAIFAGLPCTPGQLRQWMGRFVRKGMKRPVLLLFAIAEGTIDEHVAGILLDKLPAIDQLIGDEELRGLDKVLGGIGSDEEAIAGLLKALGGNDAV